MEQNLNYYKMFYEVANAGNISKAAEILHISQPALSKSISNLEHSLSLTLFVRSKRGVTLTEEGKTLYSYLKNAFECIDNAEKALQQITELGMGHLRIGVSSSLCKHILLPYLQDYIRDNPHVKISLACNPTFQTLQLLKAGEVDLGLICDTPLEKGYHFMPLHSIHDTFITTQTYLDNLALRERDSLRNAAQETEDTIPVLPNMTGLFLFSENQNKSDIKLSTKEILETSNLMLLEQENISRIYIDQYLRQNSIRPKQILEAGNMDLLIDFAAIGMGVACVVREFAAVHLETKRVIEIPMDYQIPPRTIGFVYNDHTLCATARHFVDFCNQPVTI